MNVRTFCKVACLIAVFSMLCADAAFAQRGGRGGMRGASRMMNMLGGDNNHYALLADKAVQIELALVDDQVQELEDIQEEAMTIVQNVMSEIQDIPREERGDAMRNLREKMTEKLEPIQARVKEVLLPHQHDRLKQLGFQKSGRGQGVGGALMNENLLKELDVTDEQRTELEEAIKEAKEELKEKLLELEKNAEKKILKVLDSDQREKYKELVGDRFQFENEDGGRRGGRGRDRGN